MLPECATTNGTQDSKACTAVFQPFGGTLVLFRFFSPMVHICANCGRILVLVALLRPQLVIRSLSKYS